MEHYYWSDWYSAWGWFLWFGMIFLMFSNFGNWGYTYRVHKLYGEEPKQRALNILTERYARGEILREEFHLMKAEIKAELKAEIETQNRKDPNSKNYSI